MQEKEVTEKLSDEEKLRGEIRNTIVSFWSAKDDSSFASMLADKIFSWHRSASKEWAKGLLTTASVELQIGNDIVDNRYWRGVKEFKEEMLKRIEEAK
jgi:hypothetical protein